jgi:hypothetical protein
MAEVYPPELPDVAACCIVVQKFERVYKQVSKVAGKNSNEAQIKQYSAYTRLREVNV